MEKAKLESLDAELENEKKVRLLCSLNRPGERSRDLTSAMAYFLFFSQGKLECEQRLQETQAQIKSLQSKSKQVIHDLKAKVSYFTVAW